MSYGVSHRHGLELAFLWLWCRPAAAAPIRPLAWELHIPCCGPKKTKKKKNKNKKKKERKKKEKKRKKKKRKGKKRKEMPPLLWKTVWRYLRKLNIEPPYDPTIPLLGIYPDKTLLEKTQVPVCSLRHNSQEPRQGNHLNVH